MAARLLRSWVRTPLEAWMCVVSVVLSGRGLRDEQVTRPEDSTECGVSFSVI